MLVSRPSLNEVMFAAISRVLCEVSFTPDLPAVWHYAALLSLTSDDPSRRERMRDKWVPESQLEEHAPAAIDVLAELLKDATLPPEIRNRISLIDPREYMHMILAWRYNSFGHHTDTDALCMYDTTSTMAHSCSPSAVWHFGADDAFCLRARVSLKPGDEITISYLGDEDLLRSVPERRKRTQGWLFACQCDRCLSPIDYSRGFRCPTCFIGAVYMHPKNVPVGPCSCCNTAIPDTTLERYLDLESSYTSRLSQTDQTDLEDITCVLSDARNLLHENHWIIYSLETWISDCLKKSNPAASSRRITLLTSRLNFLTLTFPVANYTAAWILEELGDCLSDVRLSAEAARNYSASYWYMQILCGSQHPFSESISSKWAALEEEKPEKDEEEGITASTTPARASPPTLI